MRTPAAHGPAEPVRRRRLALLGSRGIPARYGGFETFAEELGARLVARGHEVTVFCLAESGCPRPREHRGVRLEHLRVPRLGPLGTLLYDLRALRRARAHDVVYMLGYGAGAFLGLARAAENELWINMDGLEWRRAKWGRLARAWLVRMERRALLAADRVVFDSAAVRARVAPAEDPRVSVIPYGATLEVAPDPRTLADLGLRRHGYFLVVARFEPENHVLEILRAHARAPELALVLVGDVARAGRYGAACRAAAGPGVRFLGALHDAQALRALRGEAAAVLHGHSVGGTNPSLLEAMAAGAPVVAHDNPFNREVLGEAGAFFADAGELEARLRAVAHWDEAERARCGALHRARVGERYTWERVVAAYVELLERPAPPRVPAARRSLAEERAR